MLIDSDAVGADVECDVCIVGAGPAGITLAREFIGTTLRVALIESGTFEYDELVQRLGDGDIDSDYFEANALAEGRRRQFGGTPNRWVYTTEPSDGRRYARCVPPEPYDFDGTADHRWPFSFADLRPYYERGQKAWNSGEFDYSLDNWSAGLHPLRTRDTHLTTRVCHHGPNDVFLLRYRDDLLAADNVTLFLGCTALELEAAAPNRAGVLRVSTLVRNTLRVTARVFVLACGGVENVQLLLSSDLARPGAPGNPHDNIGRYVMDHPSFRMGALFPTGPNTYHELALYDIRWVGRQMVSAFLTLSEEVKRSEQLQNMSIALAPRGSGFGTAAHRALSSVADAVRFRAAPVGLRDDVRTVVHAPRDALAALLHRNAGHYAETHGGWSRTDTGQFRALELWAEAEQTPDRSNRLTLADRRDALGRQRLRLEYRWSESDRRNVQRSLDLVLNGLASAQLGRFQPWTELDGPHRPRVTGFHHPMGGTRMHTDPRRGVVDADARVHGLANVYVAGSSVFPNSIGYANPTLTILALTMRLADHLKQASA